MEFEERKKIHTHLNIAPLIDVVFLLLIFFMLTSHFVMQPGIKLTLPAAKTAKPEPEEDIIIFIDRDHNIYLNQMPVDLEVLPEVLSERLIESASKTVIIKSDEMVPMGLAVKIMDIAKQAEADGLVISTEVKEDAERQGD